MIGKLFAGLRPKRAATPAPLPVERSEHRFRQALAAALDHGTSHARDQLEALISALPEKTVAIDIGIHQDQDQEGYFSLMVHLQGPDLHVLNQAVRDHRLLFEIKGGDSRRASGLPLVEPWGEDFPTGEIIADCAGAWAVSIWHKAGGPATNLGGHVFDAEGFGPVKPLPLPNGCA